ncbi:hypothetical protein [Tenacibaculum sp. M341]|uniref:hypothetical protein n=1 Tax=Tenacibaculum sp. M341 TaxID=2530339 RepID=UPI00104A6B59|nr:hypothetical protein [Tenacibaculum sp. M341]TCI91454.1 hypothetical protein EYW44_10905 [Tenacibaculum sp. M341]
MELVEKKDVEILETFFKEKEDGSKELQLAFPEWMQMKNLPQRSFSHAVYDLRGDKLKFVKFPYENMESKWKKVKDYLFQYGYYSDYLEDTFELLSEEDKEELRIEFISDFIELAGDDRRFSEIKKVNKEDIVQKIRALFNYSDNELRLYYLYLQKYLEISFFKGECFYLIE